MRLTIDDITPAQLMEIAVILSGQFPTPKPLPPSGLVPPSIPESPPPSGSVPPSIPESPPPSGLVPPSIPEPAGHTPSAEQIFGGHRTARILPPTDGGEKEEELDSAGYPWDGRIHASSKTRVKDGTWRLKRGVDPTTIDPVLAEYRSQGYGPAGAQNAKSEIAFADIMALITEGLAARRFGPVQVSQILAGHGLSGAPDLPGHEHLFDEIYKQIEAL